MTNQGKKEKMGKKAGLPSPPPFSIRTKTDKPFKQAPVDFSRVSVCFL
jgi:hypothetical protein